LSEGAVRPWQTHGEGWRKQLLDGLAEHYNFDMFTPFNKLPKKVQDIILHGSDKDMQFNLVSSKKGSTYSWVGQFEGVIPQLERLHAQTQSDWRRREMEKYMRVGPCKACEGKRLRPESLAVKIGDKNIWQVNELSIDKALAFFKELKLNKEEKQIARLILQEIRMIHQEG